MVQTTGELAALIVVRLNSIGVTPMEVDGVSPLKTVTPANGEASMSTNMDAHTM